MGVDRDEHYRHPARLTTYLEHDPHGAYFRRAAATGGFHRRLRESTVGPEGLNVEDHNTEKYRDALQLPVSVRDPQEQPTLRYARLVYDFDGWKAALTDESALTSMGGRRR